MKCMTVMNITIDGRVIEDAELEIEYEAYLENGEYEVEIEAVYFHDDEIYHHLTTDQLLQVYDACENHLEDIR